MDSKTAERLDKNIPEANVWLAEGIKYIDDDSEDDDDDEDHDDEDDDTELRARYTTICGMDVQTTELTNKNPLQGKKLHGEEGTEVEKNKKFDKNPPQGNRYHGKTALFQKIIQDWSQQEPTFTVTRATECVKRFIMTNNIAIVTGSSGSGKSSIIHHVALDLQTQGYEIVPYVTQPDDLEQNYKMDRNQVFVIDDIIGQVTSDMEKENKWRQSTILIDTIFGTDLKEIRTSSDDKTDKNTKKTGRPNWKHKLLISCRSHIFLDDRRNIFANYSKYQLNLMEKDMCLLNEEKKDMLKRYVKDIPDETSNKCLELSKSFYFFPLLCKLCKGKSPDQMLTHFSKPVDNIKQDMVEIRNHENKMKFCVLALCVLCDNQFEEKWIDIDKAPLPIRHRLNDFFSCVCGIDPKRPFQKNAIADNLKVFVGTYLKKIGNCYSFIHDKIYDIAAVVCGTYLFEHFIDNASSHFIGDRYLLESIKSMESNDEHGVKPHSEQDDLTNDEYSIIVKEDQEEIYFSRLVKDLKSGDMYSFLNNKQLAKERYRKQLIGYLTEHKKTVVLLLKEIDSNENEFKQSTPLRKAVSLGYNDIAEFLVAEVGSDVNRANLYEESLLHIACKNQNQAMVKLLLNNQADVSKCGFNGRSPLHIACESGNHAMVELLLKKQANISIYDKDGRSPLHFACMTGYWNVVELLLNKQAETNKCDKNGRSPLHFACAYNARSLLRSSKHFVHVFPLISMLDDFDFSDIHHQEVDIPKRNTIFDTMRYKQKRWFRRFAVVELLLNKGADLSKCDEDGKSPLHFACKGGNPSIVELLLSKHADISKCDKNGRSPLHYACQEGSLDIVELLLNENADIFQCDKDGKSPLHFAYTNSNWAIVEVVLRKQHDFAKCGKDGRSYLHFACKLGNRDLVELILNKEADISKCDEDGKSPLHFACEGGNLSTIELLLSKEADIHKCDKNGRSPLHYACAYNTRSLLLCSFGDFVLGDIHYEEIDIPQSDTIFDTMNYKHPHWFHGFAVVELLLNKGADISKCDEDGKSPLHFACEGGNPAIIELLLRKQADIHKRDKHGRSPLHYASAYKTRSLPLGLFDNFDFGDINYKEVDIYECDTIFETMRYKQAQWFRSFVLVELLLNKGADISKCDEDGKSPLHFACKGGNPAIVEFLLIKQAGISTADKGDGLPLHNACQNRSHDIPEQFLNKQSDVSKCTKDGKSPLHFAYEVGNRAVEDLLLDKQGDISKCDEDGKTPLLFACEGRHAPVVEQLVSKQADTFKCDKDGRSPLHYACQEGSLDIVELLLNENTDIFKGDKDDRSPLHFAYEQSNWAIVELLLRKQNDIAKCDKNGRSSLHFACKLGNRDLVELILNKEADISKCDEDGKSPLHFACEGGNLSTIELLLSKQADIHKCDKNGRSPLHYACACNTWSLRLGMYDDFDFGDIYCDEIDIPKCNTLFDTTSYKQTRWFHGCAIVDLLLNKGADMSKSDIHDRSPLHYACKTGNKNVVELLLNNQADVFKCDKDGKSPLHFACETGNQDVVELLLNKKPDINKCDKNGRSPLHFACAITSMVSQIGVFDFQTINYEEVDFIKSETMFDPWLYKACWFRGFDVVELLLNKEADISQCDEDGKSPLHFACAGGNPAIVELLLSKIADISKDDNDGRSPLHYACKKGIPDIVTLLLKKHANISKCDKDGKSALIIACEVGDYDVIELLLNKQADISKCDKDGRSPLHFACKKGNLNVVELLLNNEADIHKCDNHGRSPLHFACSYKKEFSLPGMLDFGDIYYEEVPKGDTMFETMHYKQARWFRGFVLVELLLNKGADISKCDEDGKSPLHFACEGGNPAIVELILSKKTDISTCDKNGKSALIIACEVGNENVVELLLNNQADISQCDKDGKSPLHFACKNGNQKALEILINKGADIHKCDNHGRLPLHFACAYKLDFSLPSILDFRDIYYEEVDIPKGDTIFETMHYKQAQWFRGFVLVELLLNKGADISKCDGDGKSPLHFACEGGNAAVVELLLRKKSEISTCDKNGKSPLIIACEVGNENVVELLLNNQADISQCDKDGK